MVKATHGDDIRRLRLGHGARLHELRDLICPQFGLDGNSVVLRFLDDEKDWCSLTNDDQLADACIVAQSLNPPLLHVRIDEPGRTSLASSDLPVPRQLLPSAYSCCTAFAELIAPLIVCRRI